MTFTNISRTASLLSVGLGLLINCGCERAYDFKKDMWEKSGPHQDYLWNVDSDIEKRLALCPASGLIWVESTLILNPEFPRESQMLRQRETAGKMLSIYYWKVSCKEETFTHLPPVSEKEQFRYRVCFKVSEKKSGSGDKRSELKKVTFDLGRPSVAASSSKGSSKAGGSSRTSERMVIGRWVGMKDGLTVLDVTLYSGGSCVYSSGDYAGGHTSRGKWGLDGNTVTIDMADGGSLLSFSYQDGNLVPGNGPVLHRR